MKKLYRVILKAGPEIWVKAYAVLYKKDRREREVTVFRVGEEGDSEDVAIYSTHIDAMCMESYSEGPEIFAWPVSKLDKK